MSLNRFKNDITEVKINRVDTFKDEIELAMFLYICIASKNNNYNYLRFEREEILNTILKMDLNYLTVGEIASFILRVKKYKWQGLDLEEVLEDKDVKDFLISLSAEMDNKEIQKTMISRFNLETIIKVIEKLRKAYLIRKTIKALEREDIMLNIEKDIMELDSIVKEKVPVTNKVFYREESYDLIMEEKDQIEDILETDTVLDVVLKLFKQEIFLVSGEPGTGKTSFVLDIALKLEKAGHRGIFFSLEMGKKAIGNRALSIQTSIPTEEFLSRESLKKFIESFEKDKQDIFYKRIEKFRTKVKRLEIVDTTGISVDYIEEYVNNSIALSGKLDYIVVDYLQLLNGKGNNTTEIITYISKRLKEIAKKYNEKELTEEDYNKSPIGLVRAAAASAFYMMFIMAIGVTLILGIISAIQAMFSSIASKKASATAALTNWIITIAKIFAVIFIIVFVVKFNAYVVDTVMKMLQAGIKSKDGMPTYSLYETTRTRAYALNAMIGIPATLLYIALVWYTVKFLIIYVRRLVLFFMLLVASVVTPVYDAFQKTVTGKSNVYNSWLKEIIYIIMLQSLHVIGYAVLMTISMNMFGEGFISTLFMLFVFGQIMRLPRDMVSALRTFIRNNRR